MSETQVATLLRRLRPLPHDIERSGFRLEVEHGIGCAKLRIYGAQADARYREIVGTLPPAVREQAGIGELTMAWLGPREWMATGPEAKIVEWLVLIEQAGHEDVLTADLTHARTALVVSGDQARAAVASHCPLNLWPEVFPVNAVARSLLGDTSMFIARLADGEDGARFRIVVDQTMAAYAARMLAGA